MTDDQTTTQGYHGKGQSNNKFGNTTEKISGQLEKLIVNYRRVQQCVGEIGGYKLTFYKIIFYFTL